MWRMKSLLSLLPLAGALALGVLSSFYFFAKSFNGAAWSEFLVHAATLVLASAIIGRRHRDWLALVWTFFLPHLLLFAVLIMGSMEKGGWLINLELITVVAAVIWLPAFFASRRALRKI
ncbi:hypothetical protein D3C87_1668480 [compost metagenome]